MKSFIFRLFELFVFIMIMVFLNSCRDDKNIAGVETLSVSDLTHSSANVSAQVISEGGAFVGFYGFCWSKDEMPTVKDDKIVVGSGIGEFSAKIDGLESSATYYVRAFAENSFGTSYGESISFTTEDFQCGDEYFYYNHFYQTVEIAGICWFAENLRYLPRVAPSWTGALNKAYYYVYDYDGISVQAAMSTEYYEQFGVLYNWHAALEACPIGWRLPSDDDWKLIELSFGMTETAVNETGYRGMSEGSIMAGHSDLWNDGPLKGSQAFGQSGLNVIPSGYRSNNGTYNFINQHAYIWSSTEGFATSAWTRQVYNYVTQSIRYRSNKEWGIAVRCVKDTAYE